MKDKSTLFVVGASVLAVILAVILLITLLPKETDTPTSSETEPTSKTSDVVIDDLDMDTEPSDTSINDEKQTIEVDDPGLTPIDEKESSESENDTSTGEKSDTSTGEKADTTEKPVNEAKPETDKPEGGGIIIGGDKPEPYDCGTPGHHCAGPETHAFTLNLEIVGCPHCGKHNCPSFYATDEWGHTCYTPSKCPNYDIHKDPVYYCQKCGKPCGGGTNGTCAEYNVDIDCPNCGEHVIAWTCHSCK